MLALEDLNPPQRRAASFESGPLVVFAGAGSGKTRVITHRVAFLVTEVGVAPWRILCVTFTNKAAREMKERLEHLLPDGGRDLWVGTFHATCARLLRRYHAEVGIRRDFTIYDDGDQQAMVSRVLKDLGISAKQYPPKELANRIGRAKQEVLGPGEVEAHDPVGEVVQRVYPVYEQRMADAGALDFGDLIYRLVTAIEADPALRATLQGRFEHVLVDEFQDTNHVQYRLLRALCAEHRNLCVVGDDDQSIYRWRGADRRNILQFREEFPGATIVKLEQNYRSTKRILRVANAVIRRSRDREPKTLWTDNDEGDAIAVVLCEDERDEARFVVRTVRELAATGRSLADMVVFYRIHAQSRVFEEALRAANVPYRIVGGTRFYDRAEVKDVLAYLRAVHNPDDDVALLRILNVPARGIGKSTIERVLDRAAQYGLGVWGALRTVDDDARFKPTARKRIRAFVKLIDGLRALIDQGAAVHEVGQAVIDRTGYKQWLVDQDTAEADARLQNLAELVGSMVEFAAEAEAPTLAAFLELVTLQTDESGDEGARLTLMTVHAAKGLEFPVVIVAGLEEQMFPFRGVDPWEDPEEMEEERRLAYVAFTRAREQLILCHAAVRRIFGQMRVGTPSRFLAEIPSDDVRLLGHGVRRPTNYGMGRRERAREGSYQPRLSRASVPTLPGESYVDTSEGSDVHADRLLAGMRVRHRKFGVGKIVAVNEGIIPPRVTVSFPGWGQKKIAASFLEPA